MYCGYFFHSHYLGGFQAYVVAPFVIDDTLTFYLSGLPNPRGADCARWACYGANLGQNVPPLARDQAVTYACLGDNMLSA